MMVCCVPLTSAWSGRARLFLEVCCKRELPRDELKKNALVIILSPAVATVMLHEVSGTWVKITHGLGQLLT